MQPEGINYEEVDLMRPTTTQWMALAVLVISNSVAPAYAVGSEAAQPKRDTADLSPSRSSPGTVSRASEAPVATVTEDLQLLPNGDFEQGSVVWTEFSQVGFYTIVDTTNPALPVLPHGGSWLAWLGGADDEVNYIEQEIDVPASATGLSFWYWLASYDVCGFDFGWLKVDGAIVEQYDLCTDSDTDTWMLREVDFSAYAGQTVTLRFQADTDASDNSNFFVDDVAFDVAGIFSDGFESGDTSAWSDTVP